MTDGKVILCFMSLSWQDLFLLLLICKSLLIFNDRQAVFEVCECDYTTLLADFDKHLSNTMQWEQITFPAELV